MTKLDMRRITVLMLVGVFVDLCATACGVGCNAGCLCSSVSDCPSGCYVSLTAQSSDEFCSNGPVDCAPGAWSIGMSAGPAGSSPCGALTSANGKTFDPPEQLPTRKVDTGPTGAFCCPPISSDAGATLMRDSASDE
jgi:hypothetical protein